MTGYDDQLHCLPLSRAKGVLRALHQHTSSPIATSIALESPSGFKDLPHMAKGRIPYKVVPLALCSSNITITGTQKHLCWRMGYKGMGYYICMHTSMDTYILTYTTQIIGPHARAPRAPKKTVPENWKQKLTEANRLDVGETEESWCRRSARFLPSDAIPKCPISDRNPPPPSRWCRVLQQGESQEWSSHTA